jgi:MYXO-CTERM domain-containing protein
MTKPMTSLLVAVTVTIACPAFADVIPPPSDAGDAATTATDSGLPTTTRVDAGAEPVADDKAGGCSFGAGPMGRGSVGLLVAGALLLARRRRSAP